jgi:hypothetical protein
MQKNTRNLLNEITTIVPKKDKHLVIESMATQAIARVVHLVQMIEESYGPEESKDLVRRLQLAIKNKDSAKFVRGIRLLNKENNKNEG